MMKLSALLTWMVVVAFSVASTTAKEYCEFYFADDSGCTADDVAELVKLLNEKVKQQSGRIDYRDLNEKQDEEASLPASLRGTHAQEDRQLCTGQCMNASCLNNMGCYYTNNCNLCRRRDLQVSKVDSKAQKLGEAVKSELGAFGWNGCNPSKLKKTPFCIDI